MSNYTKLTDFASKDALPSGNANKIVKGTEIDDEFSAISTAVATKADTASPTFTGTPAAPTATAGTDTTQIATTAFVQDAVEATGFVGTTQLAADAVTDAKIADGAVDTEHLAADAVTGAKIADDAVGSEHIADNAVGAAALNVSGNGTSGQVLESDGDGSFSWSDSFNDVAAGSKQVYGAFTAQKTGVSSYTTAGRVYATATGTIRVNWRIAGGGSGSTVYGRITVAGSQVAEKSSAGNGSYGSSDISVTVGDAIEFQVKDSLGSVTATLNVAYFGVSAVKNMPITQPLTV